MRNPARLRPPRQRIRLHQVRHLRHAARRAPNNQLTLPKTVSIRVTLSSVPQGPSDKLFSSNCNLAVSCVAKTNLRFSAEKINFGVVPTGQTPQLSMDIEYYGNPNWKV